MAHVRQEFALGSIRGVRRFFGAAALHHLRFQPPIGFRNASRCNRVVNTRCTITPKTIADKMAAKNVSAEESGVSFWLECLYQSKSCGCKKKRGANGCP